MSVLTPTTKFDKLANSALADMIGELDGQAKAELKARCALVTGVAASAVATAATGGQASQSPALAGFGRELQRAIAAQAAAWDAMADATEAREAFADRRRPACLTVRDEDESWGIPGAARHLRSRAKGEPDRPPLSVPDGMLVD
jgi:hypothetical protein